TSAQPATARPAILRPCGFDGGGDSRDPALPPPSSKGAARSHPAPAAPLSPRPCHLALVTSPLSPRPCHLALVTCAPVHRAVASSVVRDLNRISSREGERSGRGTGGGGWGGQGERRRQRRSQGRSVTGTSTCSPAASRASDRDRALSSTSTIAVVDSRPARAITPSAHR